MLPLEIEEEDAGVVITPAHEYMKFFFDASMCDFPQGLEYSFFLLLTLDIYSVFEYVCSLGVHSFL